MAFVYSFWYIVMAILVVGIAGCLVGFFLMAKKDKELINDFIKSAEVPQTETEKATEVVEENKE